MEANGYDEAQQFLFKRTADTVVGSPVEIARTPTELAHTGQYMTQLATVLSTVADGLFILDGAGRVSHANEVGRALFGLPEGVQGWLFSDLLRPLQLRRADEQALDLVGDLLTPLLAGQLGPELRLLISRDERERIICLTGKSTRDDTDQIVGAVLLVRDITEQSRAEQEQDAFLSLIAHEVRSPLTSIKGFAQLATRALEGPGAGSERAMRHLLIIDQQTARLGRLIGDLADVSRLQRGKPFLNPLPFDLVPIVQGTVAHQRVTTPSHEIILTSPDEALIVRADPTRIGQALTNLLTNAAKFSPGDAPITVTLRRQGDAAELHVRDRGIGIAPEEQGRIFERFYRATNSSGGGGLGLGLFLVHQIVARSGGKIAVESAQERGTHFCITLPLARPEDDEDA